MSLSLKTMGLTTRRVVILAPILQSARKRRRRRLTPMIVTKPHHCQILGQSLTFNASGFRVSPVLIRGQGDNAPRAIGLRFKLPCRR